MTVNEREISRNNYRQPTQHSPVLRESSIQNVYYFVIFSIFSYMKLCYISRISSDVTMTCNNIMNFHHLFLM